MHAHAHTCTYLGCHCVCLCVPDKRANIRVAIRVTPISPMHARMVNPNIQLFSLYSTYLSPGCFSIITLFLYHALLFFLRENEQGELNPRPLF